jgi:hypothetical protein
MEAYRRWFAVALERKFFPPAELAPFARSPDPRSLAAIACPFLGGLAPFSAYARASADPDRAVARDRISAFVGAVAAAAAAAAEFPLPGSRAASVSLSRAHSAIAALPGAAGALPLPVAACVARTALPGLCAAFAIEPGALPAPAHARCFELPNAVGSAVALRRAAADFCRVGAARSAALFLSKTHDSQGTLSQITKSLSCTPTLPLVRPSQLGACGFVI